MFVPCFFSFACFLSKVSVPGCSCRGLQPRSCVGVRLHSPMDTNNKQYYRMRFLWHSESPPYSNLISLLWPLFLVARQNDHTSSCKKPSLIRSPVNMAKFFGPICDCINRAPLYLIIIGWGWESSEELWRFEEGVIIATDNTLWDLHNSSDDMKAEFLLFYYSFKIIPNLKAN